MFQAPWFSNIKPAPLQLGGGGNNSAPHSHTYTYDPAKTPKVGTVEVERVLNSSC